MFKNQLQELAQRSCFNLPSYSCVREGPDHAPRFKSTVTFNGESFESPDFCNTLRQAEHAAAEVALNTLSKRGPTQSLAARILDETGVCKNLLQETAQRAGINLPIYSVERSGPGHMPVFVAMVQLVGMSFVGESAKTKKQAEKNAATTAWASLKRLVIQASASSSSSSESHGTEEHMQMAISRFLMNAAPASSTGFRRQEPPPLSRPVPTSRITIIPLEEQPGQEAVSLPDSLSSTSIESKADSKSRSAPTARIKITPFEEQPGRETLNMPRSFLGPSIELKANKAAQEEQESGGTLQESCHKIAAISTTLSPMMASGSCSRVQQRAAHVQRVMVNHGTHSQVTYFPVSPLQSEDKNWFQNGASTFIITDVNDIGSTDNIFPGYPPVLWTKETHQDMSTDVAYKPVTSLAPSVCVRQAIPVRSAPPRTSEAKDQGLDTTKAAALQGLSNLKL
ncbi:hypothetical protein GOP47_0029650 [Adiantum capillus-veneris]|nr:hypothetical protein GOP47_0029650 [Adiantum capillus-veneris]